MKELTMFLIVFIILCIIDPLGDKAPETQSIEAGGFNSNEIEVKEYPPLTGCRNMDKITTYCRNGCNGELLCTKSMIPTMSCNDTLYFCKPDKDEININDVIYFPAPEREKMNRIHRVVGITDKGYITQGDAISYRDDNIIPFEDVLGKAYRIEKNTYGKPRTIKII